MQDYNKYRGMRAVLLTRVSTEEQKKKYSHDAQERLVREKLIEPLGLRIVDEHGDRIGFELNYSVVLKELYEKAQRNVAHNKQLATRNNQTAKDCLLRGGFAKCGYCGTTLRVYRKIDTRKGGRDVAYFSYNCARPYNEVGRCYGCSIAVDMLDAAAWEKELKKKTLSERTIAYLQHELASLEQQEQEARRNLADEQTMQQKQEKLQQRIAEFHQQCEEWRELLDDPEFTPTFKFMRDAILFFGITATVFKVDHKPRYLFHKDPPEIVELLS